MQVHSLLTNKVTITERKPGEQPKEPKMNWLIKSCTDIAHAPVMVWLIGTIIAVICVIISLGVKWGCGLLALWLVITMISYHAKRNGWGD